jgi:regulator of protease activity HflC (stomatin/prohibitin superfamily)
MAGDQKGVEDFPAVTGWVFYMPWVTSIQEYPIFMQSYVYTASQHEGSTTDESISFSDMSQIQIGADINVSYIIDPSKVASFYIKFRNDDIQGFTHGYLRNTLRDSFQIVASNYSYEDINGPKKASFMAEVKKMMNDDVSQYGVKVEQLGFVGSPRPPKQIADSINMKIQAIQNALRTQNEVVQVKAEAEKTIAKAKGEADANELLAKSLTPTLMEWRKLAITESAVQKWDGKRPMVEGSNQGLLLNITPPK